MTDKTDVVIYIDRASVEHNALVVGVNNLNPDVLDVTYFDLKSDALKTEFGVPHMSDESKKETNPELPQYSLNCWKKDGEEHLALPVDHPANDHPFELKKQDDSGRIVAKPRPEFEKHLAEVHAVRTFRVPITGDPDLPPGIGPMFTPLADEVPHDGATTEPLPTGTGYSVVPVSGGLDATAEAAPEQKSSMPITDAAVAIQLENLAAEPDVAAQLDAAGPAPVEEKKPEDAA